ncbi:ryanodine receptor 1 [Sarotherodon galilaeus]
MVPAGVMKNKKVEEEVYSGEIITVTGEARAPSNKAATESMEGKTDVIVNTISEDMNLNQGTVSKAILSAAGSSLQDAIYSEAKRSTLRYGDVVVTDGYNLTCQKVFHTVCPSWDKGGGQAEEELTSIIRYCLVEAEKRQMASLSFSAIGTGNLSFPRALVSKLLLREIRSYSSSRNPRCLREVVIVVHPSDSQTVDNKNKCIVFKSLLLTYICLMLQTASQAKKRINDLIMTEQAQKTISDPCISQLSQADMEKLKALQRELTVSIRLDKGTEDQDPEIHLEGLTKDIERVQNPSLWQNYQIMKKQMEVKNKHTNNELLLFHGTTDTSSHLINKQGFNRSYAGKHAAIYGNGSYFAVDPGYSAGNYATPDTSGHKRMYQARVLVGDYTQGQKGLLTPPPKSGSASDLYDSLTDDTANPTMFVVFNDIQAYPEYLITFT